MAYRLRYDDEVRAYLRNVEGLPREDRNRLFATIDYGLREDADSQVTDHLLTDPPESGHIRWFVTLSTEAGELVFGLIVDVSHAASGILTVVFAEEIT